MAHRQKRPAPNAMFYAEQGTTINIYDGKFTQHNHLQSKYGVDGFKSLQDHVATTAFDSVQQSDPPKCHPNTRLAVLEEIMDWILLTYLMRVQWILWLNGAAGAGKPAIARSIVELCLAKNIPVARFFFFRTDPTRNTIQPIVATLVYQLTQQLPGFLDIVISKIVFDPLIFSKSLETQLGYLLFEPLRQLHRESPLSFVVLLLDGVDECTGHDHQTNLVRLISDFLSTREFPIIAFFGSRAESQLQQVFRSHDVSTNLLQLALDDHYLADEDIHLFLNDKFKQIKETHPFNHHLGEDWPDPAHVKEIVRKSSGQFIYASVVINFVSSPRKHPTQQLEIIHGLRPTGNSTPFAQLDALYRHIFSQVEDIDRTFLLLAWEIFIGANLSYGFSPIDISVLLGDLASIVTYKDNKVHFLHASLPDFLHDQTRSERYYLDRGTWFTHLSVHCFCRVSAGIEEAFDILVWELLPKATKIDKLREHVLAFNFNYVDDNEIPYTHRHDRPYSYDTLRQYLTVIQGMDFKDKGEVYQSQLYRATRHILEHPREKDPEAIARLGLNHNISAILVQIEKEKEAKLALTRQVTTTCTTLCTSRDSAETGVEAARPLEDVNSVSQHANSNGGNRITDQDEDLSATFHRSLKLQPEENTSTSSKQPTREASPSQQERMAERRRRWLKGQIRGIF